MQELQSQKTGTAGTEVGQDLPSTASSDSAPTPAKGCLDMVTGTGTYSPASQANHWQILSRLN